MGLAVFGFKWLLCSCVVRCFIVSRLSGRVTEAMVCENCDVRGKLLVEAITWGRSSAKEVLCNVLKYEICCEIYWRV